MSGSRRADPAEAAAMQAAFDPSRASWPAATPTPEPMTGGRRALAFLRWARDLPRGLISVSEYAVLVTIISRMDKQTGWARVGVRRLARDAKVGVSTAYSTIESLLTKGLVLRRGRKGRSPFLCISPRLFIGEIPANGNAFQPMEMVSSSRTESVQPPEIVLPLTSSLMIASPTVAKAGARAVESVEKDSGMKQQDLPRAARRARAGQGWVRNW